jgi:hypothetical protein
VIKRFTGMLFAAVLLAGCSGSTVNSVPVRTAAQPAVRQYNGTASVGDFLTITLDSTAHTIAYVDHTNGDTGTVPYVVNADGTYTLSDPTHNLLSAYEVPNYALLIQAAHTGPSHSVASLVTAVESGTISVPNLIGQKFNFMQFRTQGGGVQTGELTFGAAAISLTTYWPYAAFSIVGSSFLSDSIPIASLTPDPSNLFYTVSTGSDTSTLFGTASGFFIVDTPSGSVMGLAQATTTAFQSSYAGTYRSMRYAKVGAHTGPNSIETGTPSFASDDISVTSSGSITIADPSGGPAFTGTLAPVSTVAYLNGPGGLTDPCPGLFTVRLISATSQTDIFVTFQGNAMFVATFSGTLPAGSSDFYNYSYGVGLKSS